MRRRRGRGAPRCRARWRLRAAWALGALAASGGGQARAALLDDYLRQGYVVVDQTTLPGVFTGCRGNLQLTMADGSSFTCSQSGTQASVSPSVYVLAVPGGSPSVVLIGSRSYGGQLRRMGAYTYLVPLRIGTVEPAAPSRAVPADMLPLGATGAVQSIDAAPGGPGKRLNDAQGDPLPSHLPAVPPVPPKPATPPKPR